VVRMLRILIDSGALVISETPEGYHLALNHDSKQWKMEVLALALETLGVPDFMTEDLKTMNTESQKAFREELSDILSRFDCSVDIGVEKAQLTSAAMRFSLNFDREIWDFSTEDLFPKTVSFSASASSKVAFVSEIKPLEKPKMTNVSLATILEMAQEKSFFSTPSSEMSGFDFDSEIMEEISEPDSPLSLSDGSSSRTRNKSIIRY